MPEFLAGFILAHANLAPEMNLAEAFPTEMTEAILPEADLNDGTKHLPCRFSPGPLI